MSSKSPKSDDQATEDQATVDQKEAADCETIHDAAGN